MLDSVFKKLNDKKPTCKIDNYYILLTLLLRTILLLLTATFYYCKIIDQDKKIYYDINNIKMGSNNKLKEINVKIRACYYFDGLINIHDLDLDNILLDKKSFENFFNI